MKDYGYIEKYEFVGKYSGVYKFIYPLMCPKYLTDNQLWDDGTADTVKKD